MHTTATASDGRTLSAATGMDAVTLRVGDLDGMSDYYEQALALTPVAEQSRGRDVHRVLGRGATPLVRLVHTPDLPPVDPRQPGLYHTAFLFDDEPALAATVYQAAQHARSRFTGSADHLVSEAFYFTDPEGNGIELYRDRPRDAWTITGGEIQMATLHLDPNAYLRAYLTEQAVAETAARPGRIGHVHLQVGDLAQARDFYVGALGFDVTLGSYPGAIFASAGGYHHHVAMNTWQSGGAGPRAASLGLGEVAIEVPDREELDALAARLRGHGLQFADDGRSISIEDPWRTRVVVSLPAVHAD